MSISSSDSNFALKTKQVTVPAGSTAAVFINGTVEAGCNNIWLQHFGGGTLLIFSDGSGSTMSQSALITQGATTGGFFIPAGEAFQIPGPANFYLASGSTQAIVSVMFGKTQA